MPFLDEDGVTRLTEDYLDIFAPKEELGEGDGTNAGPIYELSAKGHAEQVSTTGKNLLPNTATTRTVNGITFTVNADGSVALSGTSTGTFTFMVGTFETGENSYILNGCPSGGGGSGYLLRFVADTSYSDIGSGTNLPQNQSGTVVIYIVNNQNMTGKVFYPMIRLASITDDTYEPYTGGAPSPSPDYPQEIQVVRGRNLFGGEYNVLFPVNIPAGTQLTASCKYSGSPRPNIYYYDTNGTMIDYWGLDDAYSSSLWIRTFVVQADVAYVKFSGKRASDYMLELGSVATPYVPYGHVGMEVDTGNMFDVSKGDNGYVVTADGTITSTASWTLSDYMPVYPNALVHIRTESYGTNPKHAWYDSRKEFISSFSAQQSVRNQDVIAPSNARYLRVSIANSGASSTNVYIHTTTPIPLPQRGWVAGLPDGTADSLRLDGAGKCEWTLPTSEVVLDGTQNIVDVLVGTNNNGCRFAWVITDHKKGNGTQSNLFVSHAQYSVDVMSQSTWRVGQFFSWTNPSSVKQLFITLSQTTANEANTWLSTHPITVLYPLATPVTEDCGYIEDWPTDIPEGATITIPELDALNVKYFVANDSISQYAEQWYERTKAVEIDPVEDAIGDLTSVVANLVTHDLFYFGYDEVNGKKMISIFKRGDI